MIALEPHDGELGTSSWVLCAQCQHDPIEPGWFAIRAHEMHYVDRLRFRHYHADCGLALANSDQAVILQHVPMDDNCADLRDLRLKERNDQAYTAAVRTWFRRTDVA